MAVTPNYGWPIPVATDYVKDGYDAIADLGNAIDTTVAGLGSGLTLIATASPSAVTDVTIQSCFSATYDNYLITYTGTGTTNTNLISCQLVSGTTPNTTSNYHSGGTYITNGGGPFRAYSGSATSAQVGALGTYSTFAVIYFSNPFNSVPTVAVSSFAEQGANAYENWSAFAQHNVSSSFNGIKFIASGGATMTGTFKIYGLEK